MVDLPREDTMKVQVKNAKEKETISQHNQSYTNNFEFSFYPANIMSRNFGSGMQGQSSTNNSREIYRSLNRSL